jgi:hypothetical protein
MPTENLPIVSWIYWHAGAKNPGPVDRAGVPIDVAVPESQRRAQDCDQSEPVMRLDIFI